jgi:hypothetical protein
LNEKVLGLKKLVGIVRWIFNLKWIPKWGRKVIT